MSKVLMQKTIKVGDEIPCPQKDIVCTQVHGRQGHSPIIEIYYLATVNNES